MSPDDWSGCSPVSPAVFSIGRAVFSVVPEPNWTAQADRNLSDAISLALFFVNGGMLGIKTRFGWYWNWESEVELGLNPKLGLDGRTNLGEKPRRRIRIRVEGFETGEGLGIRVSSDSGEENWERGRSRVKMLAGVDRCEIEFELGLGI